MAISRRSALRGLGIASGTLVAALSGAFPETKLVQAAEVAIVGTKEKDKERRVRTALLHGSALDDQIRRSVNDADGHRVVERLSASGLTFDLSSATALEAVWDDDGSQLGSLLTLEAHDRHGGRTGRFIRHVAGGTVRTGYAVWNDGRPGSVDVFEMANGRIDRSAHIEQQSDGSLAIDLSDGRRVDVPSNQRSLVPGHKLGLARPMADICTQQCSTVVGLVCALACGIVFLVACALITLDSLGTLAFACFLVATTVCYFGCNWVTQTSCTWFCSNTPLIAFSPATPDVSLG
jgi:hypothetical protein